MVLYTKFTYYQWIYSRFYIVIRKKKMMLNLRHANTLPNLSMFENVCGVEIPIISRLWCLLETFIVLLDQPCNEGGRFLANWSFQIRERYGSRNNRESSNKYPPTHMLWIQGKLKKSDFLRTWIYSVNQILMLYMNKWACMDKQYIRIVLPIRGFYC